MMDDRTPMTPAQRIGCALVTVGLFVLLTLAGMGVWALL